METPIVHTWNALAAISSWDSRIAVELIHVIQRASVECQVGDKSLVEETKFREDYILSVALVLVDIILELSMTNIAS
jgi:hypothetical protein